VRHESTFTFVSVDGRKVKAVRWANPDLSPGGWVARNANVHPSAFIDVDAVVEPGACVHKNERLGPGERRTSEGWTSA